MKFTKVLASLMVLAMLALVPTLSLAEEDFGSSAVAAGQTYTLEQMLTYAMQDEYMAQAEYAAIMDAYGAGAPFSSILKAEATHIALLTRLFEAYGLQLPENTAAAKVVLPANLEETYQAGVQAEIANIAMYEAFIAQGGLSEDVLNTFTALKNASQSHLAAFSRNEENNSLGQGMRNGRRFSGNDDTAVQNGGNAQDCPLGDDCLMAGAGGAARMGGRGRNGRN